MVKYLLKRLFYIIPTFFILTFIVFCVLELSPGDPVLMIAGTTATKEQIEAVTEELGLNEPMIVRYGKYILNLFKGDMGTSWMDGRSVSKYFFERMPNTLILSLGALCLTIVIGIPFGVIAAVRQNGIIDKITLIVALFFISVPAFFLALLAQLLFAMKLQIFPVTGAETWRHYVLPIVILGVGQIAGQVRMTRSSMLDVLSQDYIRTANSKGASNMHVIIHHALRNGLLPVITGIGNSVAYLFSGAAVIEMVFAIPGLGTLMVNAVQTVDVPMVMGPIIFTSLLVNLVNTIVDMAYAFIDPRVKLKYMK